MECERTNRYLYCRCGRLDKIDLLDKGVKIEQVNGIKTLFSVSPADGSYKVNFGEEEFMNYFKEFLRPQLVEMLF